MSVVEVEVKDSADMERRAGMSLATRTLSWLMPLGIILQMSWLLFPLGVRGGVEELELVEEEKEAVLVVASGRAEGIPLCVLSVVFVMGVGGRSELSDVTVIVVEEKAFIAGDVDKESEEMAASEFGKLVLLS